MGGQKPLLVFPKAFMRPEISGCWQEEVSRRIKAHAHQSPLEPGEGRSLGTPQINLANSHPRKHTPALRQQVGTPVLMLVYQAGPGPQLSHHASPRCVCLFISLALHSLVLVLYSYVKIEVEKKLNYPLKRPLNTASTKMCQDSTSE